MLDWESMLHAAFKRSSHLYLVGIDVTKNKNCWTKIVDILSLFEGKRSAEFIWYQSSLSMILEHLCLDTKVARIYVNMLVRSNWTVYHYMISTAWLLQDLIVKPRYLITFTVGQDQKKNIDAAVKKVKLKTSSRRISPLLSGHLCDFLQLHALIAWQSCTVDRELPSYVVSLRWPDKWMGWIRVVETGYSRECAEAN